MIILTENQAEAVRGATAPGAALDPIPLADGVSWVLPEAVLADPAHALRHATLAGLPRREVAADEWPALEGG
ncbi:hypothetical protein MKI84_13210 [Ancylobacter sp. A5.8]|uniref:hypothetical protein n=1 Tax=Ancylobacter gelatini TaxID=2919920 RepID=UPI001F4D9329|nr:hypothetical protein [Ancylobacter gelatini]MCJ8143877.1 hypothetical protein [Ancylobacter gelatini]